VKNFLALLVAKFPLESRTTSFFFEKRVVLISGKRSGLCFLGLTGDNFYRVVQG
jgi:hypothetical protein